MRIRLLLVIGCMLSLTALSGRGYFQLHTEAQQAYRQIMQLRLNEAGTALSHLKLNEPDNLIIYHLENYIDFFTIYVSEDEAAFRKLLSNRNRRLDLVKSGDKNSPYYLYVQAEIRLHWALLHLRFEKFLPAFQDINKAHKLLLENQRRFPDFLPNKKDLGILHAAVGTVPDNFRWALELLSSLEGTVEQGKREIEEVLAATTDRQFIFRQETQVLYAFLLLHLDGRPEAAWRALENAELDASRSPLQAFVLANVAMRTGHNEQAIRWMEMAPRRGVFLHFPFLDYMLGVAKLRRLDAGGAVHLRTFLANTHGRHYIKEAYQKLAWAELLNGSAQKYKRNMAQVLTQGTASAGGDKNALKEAKSGVVPHIVLLKARLLFDGGYYEQANELLRSYQTTHFSSFLYKLEFLYRKGRILHGLESYELALEQYEATIRLGKNHSAFYACNAALQAGLIEEKRSRNAPARAYFKQCLDLNPDDYRTGLHQQAKAGLSRLK